MGKGLLGALDELGGQDYQPSDCTQQLPLPHHLVDPAAEAFRLTEALRAMLESQGSVDQGALRKQVTTETANVILKWLGINEVQSVLFTGEGCIHTCINNSLDNIITEGFIYRYTFKTYKKTRKKLYCDIY